MQAVLMFEGLDAFAVEAAVPVGHEPGPAALQCLRLLHQLSAQTTGKIVKPSLSLYLCMSVCLSLSLSFSVSLSVSLYLSIFLWSFLPLALFYVQFVLHVAFLYSSPEKCILVLIK